MAIAKRWRAAIESAWWARDGSPWQLGLWPLALLYRLLWWLRTCAYHWGLFKTQRAPVPVVVVGNLIVGGAGKTPCVIALAQALQDEGWSVGIISRGHGAGERHARAVDPAGSAQDFGDEPLLMSRRAQVPVWVGHDRAATAKALCQAHPEVTVLISDDGLQHHALHRDAQLVVFDDRGAGNGRVLPVGPLREPMWRSLPQHTLVLYNAPQPSTPLAGHILTRHIGRLMPLQAWWAGDTAAALTPEHVAKGPLIAAAGIGHPARFFDMLEQLGLQFQRLPLADHAALDPRPWPLDAPCVIVTEKDAVKLPPSAPDASRILVATLDLDLPPAVMPALRRWLAVAPQA
jgi:tetraacyldisaccharide 4'-kinase